MMLDPTYDFKQKVYLSDAILIDPTTGKELFKTSGTFIPKDKRLYLSLRHGAIIHIKECLITFVLDGQYTITAPIIYENLLIGDPTSGITKPIDMSRFIKYRNGSDVVSIINKVSDISIVIKAGNAKSSLVFNDKMAVVSSHQESESKQEIAVGSFGKVSVSLSSGVSGSPVNGISSSLSINVNFQDKVTVHDYFKVIQSIELYWILFKQDIGLSIKAATLNNKTVTLYDYKSELANSVDSRNAYPNASEPKIDCELLSKIISLHAYSENRDGTSQVELAFRRLVRQNKLPKDVLADDEILNIILSLQHFCEYYSKKVRKKKPGKKVARKAIKENINEVVDWVKTRKTFEDVVHAFYVKPVDTIYSSLARPQFKNSVRDTMSDLGVNTSKYNDTFLDTLSNVRQQIVHGQNYNSESLVGMYSRSTTDVTKDDYGNIIRIVYGGTDGMINDTYELTCELGKQFFIKMK